MKTLIKLGVLLLSLALTSHVDAQSSFNRYGPVAGVQKSTGTTPYNTAAVAADIYGLWSGTCSSSTFLNGVGGCAVPPGTGISFSAPAIFTVTGSPGTSISISFASGQAANQILATPDGTTGALGLRALVAGDLPPINLGSTANGGVSSTSILLGTNGGTSNGFFSVVGPASSLKTFTFPNASATVLTSNTAVTIGQGGTGQTSLAAHGVLIGEGGTPINSVTMGADTVLLGASAGDPGPTGVPNCGSSTTALSYSTSTHSFGCQTVSGGGGTPGGSNTQLQFNNSGAFDGTLGLTWTAGSSTLAQTSSISGTLSRNIQNSNSGSTSVAQFAARNDSNFGLFAGITSSGFSGAQWTNGPSGTQAYLGTDGSYPLVIGTASTARWQFGSTVSGEQDRLITNGTGNTSIGYVGIYDAAGTRWGYFGKAGSGTGDITYESDAGLRMVANNGTDALTIDTSHALKFNGTALPSGPITCTTACSASGLVVGQMVIVSKGGTTTRTSNTTPSLDPDLQITSVPAGTYAYKASLYFSQLSGGGMQIGPVFSGAIVGPATQNNEGVAFQNGSTCSPTTIQSVAVTSSSPTLSCSSGTSEDNVNIVSGNMTVSTSGTFGFTWAQNTSSGLGTILSPTSWVILTRIQ